MKMRTGTNTGKVDSCFNPIKVGDTLRPNNPELFQPGFVDNYGTLVTMKCKISPKDWNGEDYTIQTEDEQAPEEEVSISIDKETKETWTKEELKEQVAYWKGKYEEITIAEFDATAMVAELRNRGYEVTCKRTIVEEL